MNKQTTEDRQIGAVKLLNAPIDKVWAAWTDPLQTAQWWAPKNHTTTIHQMHVKEGEEWRLTIHGPDGKNYPNRSIYREVIPQKKIVFEHFNPGFMATVKFEAQGEKTLLEWISVFETKELFEIVVNTFKADKGLIENIEKLENFLAQKR